MEVNIEELRKTKVEEFSQSLAELLQNAIQNIPLGTIQKVLANHQVDLSNLYVQALLSQQFQSGVAAAQEALSVPQS